jgi:hypothetical protein
VRWSAKLSPRACRRLAPRGRLPDHPWLSRTEARLADARELTLDQLAPVLDALARLDALVEPIESIR